MPEAVIIDAVRTPVGRHGGALASVRPDDLAALVLKALIERTQIDPAIIEEVYFGCANQAGEDNRNVARMATILAGFPYEVPAVTFNRLCASSLAAINTAARAIKLGDGDVYIAGGVESMSRAPWSFPKSASAFPFGNVTAFDTALGWRYPNEKMQALFPLESMGETAVHLLGRDAPRAPREVGPAGQDLHTPKDGFLWSHIGWVLCKVGTDERELERRWAPELVADPVHRVLNRIHWVPNVALGIAFYAWGGWPLVVWGVFVRLLLTVHGTWFVNSASHTWGYRTFATPDCFLAQPLVGRPPGLRRRLATTITPSMLRRPRLRPRARHDLARDPLARGPRPRDRHPPAAEERGALPDPRRRRRAPRPSPPPAAA